MNTYFNMRRANVQNNIRSATPISNEQIARVAPSIFATEPHESRSEKYTYIPTVEILTGLRKHGFEVFAAGQSRCRDVGKREFTKHMLRLRRDTGTARILGEELPEVVLINSHDGTSSYQMMAGMFRLVCLNGLVVPSSISSDIRIPHKGDILNNVIEGAFSVVENFDKTRANIETMKALTLSTGEARAFASAALVAKYGEPEGVKPLPISPERALDARRREDPRSDLWTTFNRVQENLVRGGQSSRSAIGRRTRTREVAGISQNVQLNRALWTLADEMARLKGGVSLAA